ncbi:MAG: LptF/LptG family permease [Planctomycetota bacterium]
MLTILRAHTLQRYVLREFGKVFALSLLVCTLFMLLAIIFITAREWEEYGVTVGQVSLLFIYLLPKTLSYAVPPATMIAATMVFGRLTAENEMLAMQSGGAPIRVIALPAILSTFVLSLGCLWCNQTGLYWGFSTLRNDVLKLNEPESFLKGLQKEGASLSLKPESGGLVRLNMLPHTRDPNTGATRMPIHIAWLKNNEVGRTILAADHQYEPGPAARNERVLTLTLKDAQVMGDEPAFTTEFTTDELRLPPLDQIINIGDTRGQRGWYQNWEEANNIRASIIKRRQFLLQRAADFGAQVVASAPMDTASPALSATTWSDARLASEAILGKGGALDRARAEEIEFHRKLALSFLPLSLGILGIGLGLLVRKAHLLIGFLLGLLVYALVYYPLAIVSKEMVVAGVWNWYILWLPNGLLFVAGYGLWRAYERGWLSTLPRWLAGISPQARDLASRVLVKLWKPFTSLRNWIIWRLRCKTDGYVAGSFVTPFIVVVLCMVALFTAMDLINHGPQVVNGIVQCDERIKDRTMILAILDVINFYAINSLEWICDLLPLLLLLSGVLCVFVMVRNNEHLIFKSSGVSLRRAFRPIIIIAVIISVFVALLRETVIPKLVMCRDQLKPLVYFKAPNPTALALYTTDVNGHPVLFQMSQYSAQRRIGRDLRVYLLSEMKDGRIPTIIADRATWTGEAWQLQTEPKSVAQVGAKHRPANATIDHGFKVTRETGAQGERPVQITKTPLVEWRGGVTPSIIESDRLGLSVMSFFELYAAAAVKRSFVIELWRRALEVVMAIFLLWTAIPLLLKEEVRRPLVGVGGCILLGAMYWCLNLISVEAARGQWLPTWAPVLPHLLFLGLGYRQYYATMET